VSKHDLFFTKRSQNKRKGWCGGYADSREKVDGEENLEKSLQILFAYLIWGKRLKKKNKATLRCLVSDSKLVLWWRLALNKSVGWWCWWSEWDKLSVCLLWMNSTTNKQTAHCVMTQAVLSSSNNMGYKWYENW